MWLINIAKGYTEMHHLFFPMFQCNLPQNIIIITIVIIIGKQNAICLLFSLALIFRTTATQDLFVYTQLLR